MKHTLALLAFILAGTSVPLESVKAEEADKAQLDSIVSRLRTQGFPCEEPLGATLQRQESEPNRAVWIVRCENATGNVAYRAQLVPNVAAQIERIEE